MIPIQYYIFRSHQGETTLGLDSSHIIQVFSDLTFPSTNTGISNTHTLNSKNLLVRSIIWNLNSIYANKYI